MAQININKQKLSVGARARLPLMTHYLKASFLLLLSTMVCLIYLSHRASANPFVSSTTPGMVMANMTFDINSPEDDRLIIPSQMRLKIMNSAGKDLIYVETSLSNFDPSARFAYDKNDPYKRPVGYPHTRDIKIIDKPRTYKVALERYKRSIYLYKASSSISSREQAKSYMQYCYKQALALYKKDLKAKASAH